jgi:YfiH family protein
VDGHVTTSRGVLLTVTIADCIPVYLSEVGGRGVALLHAGWRGIAGGILERGVRLLAGSTGSRASSIAMHCGVGICERCYEVGREVMDGCGRPADGVGPWHLDLRQVLVKQGEELGLVEISTSGRCTRCQHDLFFSHRASAGSDGRQVAYLGLTPQG